MRCNKKIYILIDLSSLISILPCLDVENALVWVNQNSQLISGQSAIMRIMLSLVKK